MVIFLAFFFGYAVKQRQCRLLKFGYVHRHVVLLASPLSLLYRLPCEHCLVYVYDSISIILRLSQQSLHGNQSLSVLVWIGCNWSLVPSKLLFLYLVHLVYLSHQSRVHMCSGELSPKVSAPIDERHGCLPPQRVSASDPLNLMLFEDAIPVILAWKCLLRLL